MSDARGANREQSSGALDTEAELRKLAHALGVEPDRLGMLTSIPADDLRTLRAQVSEAMFQADKHYFVRVATLSKTVPAGVSAKLTEAALPPLLAARTAELLEPAKAVDMVSRISDRYLADVSAVMDPARAPEVVAAIPPERVAKVGQELAERGEWIVMGGFVSHISADALRVSVAGYTGEQLLRVGFVLDDPSLLNTIGAMLTDAQVDDMLAAAVQHSLWDELSDLLEHLSDERAARMALRFAEAAGPVQEPIRAGLEPAALARLEP
jgi:hypothetical protein